MAIYHLSVKAVSRSAGRSATGAAAYRAGVEIADERTGEIHDYTRKSGVESADIVLPDGAPEWAKDRAALWNAAELSEKRKDACVAREFEVALPSELSPSERRRLAVDFAKEMANAEGCAVDVCIHEPNKKGDERNHHAHILRTTRKVEAEGLGAKLDTEKAGRNRKADLEAVRGRWADLVNERLRENGIDERIDHRTLEAQGIDREPTRHLGPSATGYERRTGEPSRKRQDWEQIAADRLTKAKELGEAEREIKALESSVIELSGNIAKAKAELAQQVAEKSLSRGRSGLGGALAQSSLETPQKPVEAVLRQEGESVIKPGETALQASERLKKGYFEELRDTWRKTEAENHARMSAGYAGKAQDLRASEEPRPRFFGVKDWEARHQDLDWKASEAERLAGYHGKRSRDTLKGDWDHDSGMMRRWNDEAVSRLEREHPQLAQDAKLERAAAEEKAKNDRAIDRVMSDFKALASKREGKFLGYRDGGSNWEALPNELKSLIEGYNAVPREPKEAREIVLGRYRENFSKPEARQYLADLIERGKEKSREQDRGMSR